MKNNETRYCPSCGWALEGWNWKRRGKFHCPICGLDGSRKHTLDSPDEIREWKDGYDEDWLKKNGYGVMTYPDCLELVGREGFRDNIWIIADDEGEELYGRFSYVYRKDWLDGK